MSEWYDRDSDEVREIIDALNAAAFALMYLPDVGSAIDLRKNQLHKAAALARQLISQLPGGDDKGTCGMRAGWRIVLDTDDQEMFGRAWENYVKKLKATEVRS